MTRNIIVAAVELVDARPSDEFVANLGRQLLADLDATHPPMTDHPSGVVDSQSAAPGDYVTLSNDPSRRGRTMRPQKILLFAAACLAVFAAAALIATRRQDSPEPGSELTDIDPREAQQLADAAGISADVLGVRWAEGTDQGGVPFSQLSAETTAVMPRCAELSEFGVWSPTTKSVTAHQYFMADAFMYHEVMVFASTEDASRAMDMIETELFQTCTFDRFDRLAKYWRVIDTTSRSEAWDGVPEIGPYGDRQVIVGQHLVYRFAENPGPDLLVVNAYIQVGRAIAWVDPLYNPIPGHADPTSGVDAVLKATTASLQNVFGD